MLVYWLSVFLSTYALRKSQNSPENVVKKEGGAKHEPSTNGRWNGTSHASKPVSYETESPKSSEYEETDGELQADPLDRRYL